MTVEDVNDNSPIPQFTVYNGTVKENSPVSTVVSNLNIVFTDADSGVNAALSYSLSPSVNFSLASTDSTVIRTNAVFDYEQDIRRYELEIIASDAGATPNLGSARVLIDIVDENDNRPNIEITSTPSAVFTEEGPPVTVTTIAVTDMDSSAFKIQYAFAAIVNKIDTNEKLSYMWIPPPGSNLQVSMSTSNSSLLVYGEGSVEEYSSFLSTVTYQSLAEEITLPTIDRIVTFGVSDIPYLPSSDVDVFLMNYDPANVSSINATVRMQVVNDQPQLNCPPSGMILLPSIMEDITDDANTGITISSSGIISLITDNDNASPTIGIAVVGATGQGQWQYAISGSSFTNFVSLSLSSATVLAPNSKIRFLPNLHISGSASISFRAWDRTDGSSDGSNGVNTTAAVSVSSSAFSSVTCQAALEITPVNDAPVLDLDMGGPNSPNFTTNYTENQTPSRIYIADPLGVTITDVDHKYLNSLTVSISKTDGSCDLPDYPYNISLDYLVPANLSILGISETYTTNGKACWTYTYTGNHTIGNWEWFIGMLRLSINNTEPSDHTRLISYVINDDDASSAPVYSTVDVFLVSDNCAELYLCFDHVNYPEHILPYPLDPALNITDNDYRPQINSITVTITVPNTDPYQCDNCVLNVITLGSFTAVYANKVLTLIGPGSPQQFQTILRTLTFHDTQQEPSFSSMVTLVFTIDDGTVEVCPTAGELTIVLQPSNDFAPTILLDSPNVNFSTVFIEDDESGTAIVGNSLEINDPDTVDSSNYTVTVTITNGISTEDNLTVSSSISPIEQSKLHLVIQATTLSTIATALTSIRYINHNEINPSTIDRVIRIYITDESLVSSSAYTTITIQSRNDPPHIDLNSLNPLTRDHSVDFDVGGNPVSIAPDASISDPDGMHLTNMTLVLQEVDSNGTVLLSVKTGESLTFTSVAGIAGSYDEATATLQFTGTSTLANYQQLLRSVKYSNIDNNPTLNQRIITVTINDGFHTASAESVVSIGDLPTPPIVDLNGGSSGRDNAIIFTTKENDPVNLAPQAVITDMENDNICSASITYTGPSKTCTYSALDLTTSFSDLIISPNVISGGFSYSVFTTFSQCRQGIIFDNLLRSMTFEAPDTAPAGTCTIKVTVTDFRNGTSLPSYVTIAVIVGNEPPFIDLDLGRVGRHFSFEYTQGIDEVSRIASRYDESLARNITSLSPVGEAPGEAMISDELGALIITNLSYAGYIFTDSDNTTLEYLSARFIYESAADLAHDAIRFPCVPINKSIIVDPIGCTKSSDSVTYADLECDQDLFDACNSPIDLCTNLRVTITCGSKDYRFHYTQNGATSRYSALLGYLGYQHINDNSTFARFERSINITASDGIAVSSGALCTISIVPSDDTPTVVADTPAFVMYENDIPNRGLVYYTVPVNTSEGTRAPAGSYVLEIVGGDNVNGTFSMTEDGQFRLIGSLDYETKTSYNVIISARYLSNDPRATATSTIVINVIDVNDNRPQVQASYNVSVYEGIENAFVVAVNATDRDSGLNAVLVYSPLLGLGVDNFEVNRTTGEIRTTEALNTTNCDYYLLILLIHDLGEIELYTHTVINVYVLPTPPDRVVFDSINSISTIMIPESTSVGTYIGSVLAYEIGTMDFALIRYRVISVTPSLDSLVYINEINGKLYLGSIVDAETTTEYLVTVEAYSIRTGIVIISATWNITIIITDVDEFPPVFVPPGTITVTVKENVPIGQKIAQLQGTDNDISAFELAFRLIAPDHLLPFNVTQNGSIIVIGSLDYENVSSYTFYVEVTNILGSPSLFSNTTVFVVIENVIDIPLVFTGTPYIASVNETAPNNFVVLTVSVVDPENITANVSFNIQNIGTPFCMDNSSSIIVCNSSQLTAIETENYVFNLAVNAIKSTNDGSLTTSTSVIIHLILINEYQPVFVSDTGGFLLIEEQDGNCSVIDPGRAKDGDFLHSFRAIDADGGPNGILTYTAFSDRGYGPFTINSTGQLIVDGCVDADIDGNRIYLINVNVTDGADIYGTQYVTTTANTFTLRIRDYNDNPPVIAGLPLVFYVRENETANEFVFGRVEATDNDVISINTNVRFLNDETSLAEGAGCNNLMNFNIDYYNGDLYFCREINFEATSQRVFMEDFTASNPDGYLGVENVIAFTITVHLVDHNEFRPMILGSFFEFSTAENQANNTFVGIIPSTDHDANDGQGGMLKYYLSTLNVVGMDNSCSPEIPFYALPNGSLYTCDSLDYESKESYFFYVSVCDLGDIVMCTISTRNVSIFVIDRNDNPPIVPSIDVKIYLFENTTTSLVYTIIWTDADSVDNSNVTLSLNHTDVDSPFDLVGNELVITDLSAINYEVTRNYCIYIILTNFPKYLGDKIQVTIIKLNICIIDVNDVVPSIFDPTRFDVRESEPAGFVGRVNATDEEEGENGRLTFTSSSPHVSTDCTGLTPLMLNITDGSIYTCHVLDHETAASYVFPVKVCDNGTPQLCTTRLFIVNVTDINDNPPVFPSGIITFSIYENLKANSIVYAIETTDKDGYLNSAVIYSFVNTSSPFNITNFNKIYYTGSSPLDYESNLKVYMLVLRATNPPNDPSDLTHIVDIVIIVNLIDRNDNPPVFDTSVPGPSIRENSIQGSIVYNFSTSDVDSQNNSDVYYAIITSGTPFAVDGDMIVVEDQSSLDREVLSSSYTILVEAVNEPGLSDDVTQYANLTLHVVIEDVNDNAPQFYGVSNFIVQEDFTVGYHFHNRVQAQDPDEGLNGMVVYTVESSRACSCHNSHCVSSYDIHGSGRIGSGAASVGSGALGDIMCTSASPFEIDPDSGRFSICHLLDFEEYCEYNITVQACDLGGAAQLCTTTDVIVNVMDVNDNSPRINGPFVFAVNETVSNGFNVGCINATDLDTSLGGTLRFYSNNVVECSSSFPFEVVENSGCVLVCNMLNYEHAVIYTFELNVTDLGNPMLDSTASITIMVTNVNDHGPMITTQPFANVLENSINALVIDVDAIDIDHAPFNSLTFSLLNSAGNRFNITTDGRIYTAVALDREQIPYHLIQVEVSDGIFTTNQTINVTVDDVNDNRPYYVGPSSFEVEENSNFSVTLEFRDDDANENAVVVIFSTSSEFVIEPDTLTIRNAKEFDRDPETGGSPTITIQVIAVDNGSNRLFSLPVYITFIITDVNDNSPIPLAPFSASVRDNTQPNVYVSTLNATDYDEGLNAELQFTLLNNTNMFYVNSTTGELYTNSIIDLVGKRAVTLYLLILVSDQGTPSLDTTYTFQIFIVDNLPIFDPNVYTFFVQENAFNAAIGQVFAIDRDLNLEDPDFVYTIVYSCPYGGFTLINNTIFSPSLYLDYEDNNMFELIVGVGTIDIVQDTATVFINVNNTNDNVPVLSPLNVSVNLPENVLVGHVVATLVAIDIDSGLAGTLTFSLLSGAGRNLFIIDSEGKLKTNSTEASNYEAHTGFIFTYRACDNGNPKLCSDIGFINIAVEDIDDVPPTFTPDSYSASVNETIGPNKSILSVSVSDIDTRPQDLTFTLVPPQVLFKIDANGVLSTTTVPLDYEKNSTHMFNIVVADQAGATDTATVTITVLDQDDNKPYVSSDISIFAFNEGQKTPIYFNALNIVEPDSVSLNTMDKLTLRLKPSPSVSAVSYPLEGGFCDNANYTIIDNSSSSLCYIESSLDLLNYLTPVGAKLDNGIFRFNFSDGSLGRTDEIPADVLSLEDSFSIGFWTQITATHQSSPVQLFSIETASVVLLRVALVSPGNNIQIASGSGAQQNIVQTTGVNIAEGKSHYIVIVRSGDVITIYVDGVQRGSSNNANDIITGGDDSRHVFVGEYMTGYMSNIRFSSNYSLTIEDILCTLSCGEIINATSTQNVTATVDIFSRSVSLTCNIPNSCTLNEMNAALDGVSYTNAIDEPNPEPRGLFVSAKDAVGYGTESIFSITPNLVNDKRPVLDLNGRDHSGINYELQYIELSDPISIFGTHVDLYDLDSGFWRFNRVSVELLNATAGSEFLTFSASELPSGVEIVNNTAVTLGLIVRSNASQDLLPSALVGGLRAIKYYNNLKNPTNTQRDISLTVYDFQSVHTNSPPAIVTINILLANDPPVISIGSSSVTFVEERRTLTLLESVSFGISDPDSTEMSRATVTLQNTVNGNDEFLYLSTTAAGINSSYEHTTGVLTINGTASVATYVELLKAVVYNNSNLNPTPSQRQVIIQVTDDKGAVSNSVSVSITIELFNDGIRLIFGSSGTNIFNDTQFIEDTDDCVPVLANFTFTDPENAGFNSIKMSIPNVHSTEYLTPTGLVLGSFLIQQTIDNNVYSINILPLPVNQEHQIDQLLSMIQYCNSAEEPIGGERMIEIAIQDKKGFAGKVANSVAYSYITIVNVNDPPALEIEAAQGLSYGGEPVPFINPSNINLTDHDSTEFTGVTVTITNPQDSSLEERIQTLGNLPSNGFFEGPNIKNGSFVFTIDYPTPVNNVTIIKSIQALLYTNDAGLQITVDPPRVVCIQVNDGQSNSNPECVSITVEVPNQSPPVFLNNSQVYQYNETTSSIIVGYFIGVDYDIDPVAAKVFYSIDPVESFSNDGTMTKTSGIFDIDTNTGLLTIPNGLDAESYIFHNVTLRVRDNGNPNRFDTLSLMFNVFDVNDNAPQFTNLPYIPSDVSFREELVPYNVRRDLYTITAVDADLSSSNNKISFGLVNTYYTEQGDPIFHINSSTGVLYYNRRLDAEQTDVFVFNVSASDNGSPPLINYTIIEFIPVDINDNPAVVNQLTPSLFVTDTQREASSIGPAIRVTDPDDTVILSSVNISITNPLYSVTDYTSCMINVFKGCQEERANLTSSSVNLMSLATFSGAGVTDTTLGERQCPAKHFVRLSNSSADGYGRIPRSSLSPSFGSGEMSFSFVANITNEGHIVGITDSTVPNADPRNVDIVFGIWIRRTAWRFTFSDSSGIIRYVEYSLSGSETFFNPGTSSYTPRHYILVIRTENSGTTVDFYVNCELAFTGFIAFLPAVPFAAADVFIGRTIPGTSTNDNIGHRHFGGDIHGLFYYPYALSQSQVSIICACEKLIVPTTYPNSLIVSQLNPVSIGVVANGTANLAVNDINGFLRSITYTNVLDTSITGSSRSLKFVVDESGSDKISDGTIHLVNSDTSNPVFDANGGDNSGLTYVTSFTEDGSPVSVTGSTVTITRSNSANVIPTIQRVLVELLNPVDGNTESITGQSNGYVTLRNVSSTQLELTGPGLPSDFAVVLKNIQYFNSHQNPNTTVVRMISFTVYDTEGRRNDPLSYTEITIISTNDSPQLSFSSAIGDTTNTVVFTEGGNTVLLAAGATITDVDSAQFTSATISITNNFVAGKDRIHVSTGAGITSSYDINTGVLILSGTASLADYHSALRNLSFDTTDNPLLDDSNGIEDRLMRTITLTVNDGLDSSNSISAYVEFITVNDPTTLHINGSSVVTYIEGQQAVYLLPNAYITDSDNTIVRSMRVEFLDSGENGDVFSDDGGTIQINELSYTQRSISDLVTILRNITYSNTLAEPSLVNRTVVIILTDLADREVTIILIVVVKDQNDNAPEFINSPYFFTLNENSKIGTTVGVIQATDADRTPTTLVFTSNTNHFTLVRIDDTSVRIVSAKVFDYETEPESTFTVYISDGVATTSTTVTVTIINVNEPPVIIIIIISTAAAVHQSRPLFSADSITITDEDVGDTVTSAMLTLSNVPAGSNESLSLNQTITGYTFTAVTQGSSVVYTLSGTGISLSSALQYIQYTAGDITNPLAVRNVFVKVTDGNGLDSNTVTIDVTLADEPSFTQDSYSVSLDEHTLYYNFLQIQATVANPHDTIEYSVEQHTGIIIDSTTGYLSLTQGLDYETEQSFSFRVYAVASIPLPRTASTTVYIIVIDVNDVAPSFNGINNITIQTGVPKRLFDGIDVMDPDTHPLTRVVIRVNGDPLQPHPFSGKVCVDENTIITKMVSICSLSDFINLLSQFSDNDTTNQTDSCLTSYPGIGSNANLTVDSYGNRILSISSSYFVIDDDDDFLSTNFQGRIDYLTFAFWFKPKEGKSGYIVYFGSIDYTIRYFTVFYDSGTNRIEVTFKRYGATGITSHVTVIFQMLESIEDGKWHFIMIQYSLRVIVCSVDGVPITSLAVIYADLSIQSTGELHLQLTINFTNTISFNL